MAEQKDTDSVTKDREEDVSVFASNIDMFMRNMNKAITVFVGFRRITGKLTKVDKRFLVLYVKNDAGTHMIPLKRISEVVLQD